MVAYAANKDGDWDDATMWTPNGEPTTGDDTDFLTFKATLPVDYQGKARSITGGVGSGIIYSAGSKMTLDDDALIDYSVETVTMTGTKAKPVVCTSAASGTPTNKIPAGMTTIVSTYGSHEHMAALLKASSMTLTDSEYWFHVGTAPEEQVVAGTWTTTRSIVGSYDREQWYVKPTGTLTIKYSFFFNCVPSIYSTNYYVVLYQMPWLLSKVLAAKVVAESSFLGSTGGYSEVTGYVSAKVIGEGRLSMDDLALWDHVLDHKIFVAELEEILADQDEIFELTWSEGHFAKAELTEFSAEQGPGESDERSSRVYRFMVKERPYN